MTDFIKTKSTLTENSSESRLEPYSSLEDEVFLDSTEIETVDTTPDRSSEVSSIKPFVSSAATETIDITGLFSLDVSSSGSFNLGGEIWASTFGKMLQGLPIPVFLVDDSQRIAAANQACSNISPQYVKTINSPFSVIFSDLTTAKKVAHVLATVFSAREHRVVEAVLKIGKHKVYGRLTFRSVRIASSRYALVLVEDLTSEKKQLLLERKHNDQLEREIVRREQAEKDLAESEKRYRQVVEQANDAIYQTDYKGCFTFLNSTALSRSGYTQEDLMGKHFLITVHTEHQGEVGRFYARQFADKIPETYHEFPIVTKHGETIWVGQNVQMLVENDRILGFQAIARDITDRKNAEQRLKESLREKEVLMREIHHRVKNNFQIVAGLLELQSHTVDNEMYLEMFRSTEARINAMALVHEKLYQSDNLADIRIDEYIARVVEDLLGFCGQHGARIGIEMDVQKLCFGPDTAIHCGLIVTELVNNAITHAFADRTEGNIRVSLQSIGHDRYELAVCDNGIGMPMTHELEDSRSLGLDLVLALARKLRGDVEVSSSQGTEFRIRFKEVEEHTPGS
jgi:PAS domain S-box-containing protein